MGRRPHGSSKDMALPSLGRYLDWTETPASGRVSSQQSTEQPTVLLIHLVPFLLPACFLSPQRHRVALRGRHEMSEGWATAWAGRGGPGLQRAAPSQLLAYPGTVGWADGPAPGSSSYIFLSFMTSRNGNMNAGTGNICFTVKNKEH